MMRKIIQCIKQLSSVQHCDVYEVLHDITYTCFIIDAPSNVNATALTSHSVEVTWDAFPVSSGVTGYNISYTTTASYTSGGSVIVNDVTTASITFTNLEEYTNYTITVRATSNSGMSENSNEVLITTYTAGK